MDKSAFGMAKANPAPHPAPAPAPAPTALSVLRRAEWSGRHGAWEACPICYGLPTVGHRADCDLDAVLRANPLTLPLSIEHARALGVCRFCGEEFPMSERKYAAECVHERCLRANALTPPASP